MIKEIIIKDLQQAWKKLGFEYSDKYYVEVPKNPEFGDFSTNAALVNARRNSINSKVMAQQIADYLSKKRNYKAVKTAGNGFINFEIAPSLYYKALKEMSAQGKSYGRSDFGQGKKVLIEFVSANPTGPLNVVNARAAAFGDILYRVMNYAGFLAKREFYINDAGNQVDVLAESLEMRYREVVGEKIEEMPIGTYQGEYIIELALKLKAKEGTKVMHYTEADKLEKMKNFALEEIHQMQRESLERFGVEFDSWVSEKILRSQGVIEEVLSYLAEADCTYENEDAIWFSSSKFGDEKDRVLMKSDGEITYFVPDLAYHLTKYHRGFDYMIDVLGPDHHGYVPRLKAAIRALKLDENMIEIVFLQQVNLYEGGEKVKMSKRTGNIITMDELVNEVGVDAARFFFLEKKPSAHLNFDLELAKKKTNENPVYYCQYAHARICSVLKKAKKEKLSLKNFQDSDLKKLKQDEEMAIIKKLVDFPDLIINIAETREPHRLAFYTYDVASLFHKYYQKYQIVNPQHPELSRARLFLITEIKKVLAIAFELMGITAPDKMTRKDEKGEKKGKGRKDTVIEKKEEVKEERKIKTKAPKKTGKIPEKKSLKSPKEKPPKAGKTASPESKTKTKNKPVKVKTPAEKTTGKARKRKTDSEPETTKTTQSLKEVKEEKALKSTKREKALMQETKRRAAPKKKVKTAASRDQSAKPATRKRDKKQDKTPLKRVQKVKSSSADKPVKAKRQATEEKKETKKTPAKKSSIKENKGSGNKK
jgi:arginyl-tRNA synthetase